MKHIDFQLRKTRKHRQRKIPPTDRRAAELGISNEELRVANLIYCGTSFIIHNSSFTIHNSSNQ